jgi:APA family basic amino acid/polyamine antiporter
LYIVAATGICTALLILKPVYTWPGVGIVLAGIPVFYIWRRFGSRPA